MEFLEWFLSHQSIFPITVIFAIALFVVKEIVEYIKRGIERRRKLYAYKILIAEEMLRNAWALTPLRLVIPKLGQAGWSTEVINNSNGSSQVTVRKDESWSANLVLPFYSAIFDKYLVDIAVVDKKFFESLVDTYQVLSEMKVARSTMLEMAADPFHEASLGPYIHGVSQKADSAETKIKETYMQCTGKEISMNKHTSFLN